MGVFHAKAGFYFERRDDGTGEVALVVRQDDAANAQIVREVVFSEKIWASIVARMDSPESEQDEIEFDLKEAAAARKASMWDGTERRVAKERRVSFEKFLGVNLRLGNARRKIAATDESRAAAKKAAADAKRK